MADSRVIEYDVYSRIHSIRHMLYTLCIVAKSLSNE